MVNIENHQNKLQYFMKNNVIPTPCPTTACKFQRAIMNHRQTDVENGMINELCEDDNEMISWTPDPTTAAVSRS